jgi:hypothetical protein
LNQFMIYFRQKKWLTLAFIIILVAAFAIPFFLNPNQPDVETEAAPDSQTGEQPPKEQLPKEEPSDKGAYQTNELSDTEKKELYLSMLEKFVERIEEFYLESDISEPNTGRYSAAGPGVTQPRGSSNISIILSLLLTEYPERDTFTSKNIPRNVLMEHLIQNIRHNLLTSKGSGKGYDKWGGGTWQASLELYPTVLAAHLIWGQLDEETQGLVRKAAAYEADILIKKPPANATPGNTGAEDNGWNMPTPTIAAAMFPDHPNAAAWEEAAKKHAMNASSVPKDRMDTTIVDGKPVKDWVTTTNLKSDWTMENHGFFNPLYQQVALLTIGDGAAINMIFNKPIPEAFSYHTIDIWNEVLSKVVSNDGDLVMVNGQDWVSKDYQHLGFLAMMATVYDIPEASVFESRALQNVKKRQAAQRNGSFIGLPELGYETMIGKRMAFAYLMHKYAGPSDSSLQYDDVLVSLTDTKYFPESDFVIHRNSDQISTFSWGKRPMGLVVPVGTAFDEDSVFTYYDESSLIGDARTGKVGEHYYNLLSNGGFSTSGEIGNNQISMTSLPNQTTLLFDMGTTRTFYYAVERIQGLTGERKIYHQGGTSDFGDNIPGDWINIGDRLGLVVKGGAGISSGIGPSFGGDKGIIWGSNGSGTGNRGAVIYSGVNHKTTEELSESVKQIYLKCGWTSLFADAPDGSLSFAVANLGGKRNTSIIEFSSPNGAPVFEEISWITGSSTKANITLKKLKSKGEVVNTFIVSDSGDVQARQVDTNIVRMTNPNDTDISVLVRVNVKGTLLEKQVSIPAGKAREVSVADGKWVETEAQPDPIQKPQPVPDCDETAPVTDMNISQGTVGSGGWYRSDVGITLKASDSAKEGYNSGVEKIEYQVNGGAWRTFDGNLILSEEGEHFITYRSIDKVGNVEETKNVIVKIDKTSPDIKISVLPEQPDGKNDSYVSDVNIELTSEDSIQIADEKSLYKPIGSFVTSSQDGYPPGRALDEDSNTFWVSGGKNAGEGPHPDKPVYYGVDLGRQVNVNSITVVPRPNFGPKTFSIQASEDGGNYRTVLKNAKNNNKLEEYEFPGVKARYIRLEMTESWDRVVPSRNVQIAELTFSGKNVSSSGTDRIEYQINGGGWKPYNGTIHVKEEGDYKVDYRAVDRAGNVSLSESIQFKIDRK